MKSKHSGYSDKIRDKEKLGARINHFIFIFGLNLVSVCVCNHEVCFTCFNHIFVGAYACAKETKQR